MEDQHLFEAHLTWQNKENVTNYADRKRVKNHTISIKGKMDFTVSAAPIFKGDKTVLNPEDLLLTSVMSCHMMSFLFVCQQQGLDVTSYEDDAQAVLSVSLYGSGKITKVNLFPNVKLIQEISIEALRNLHQKAHELCFIANSVAFPIEINCG